MQTKQRGAGRMRVQSPLALYLNSLLALFIISLLCILSFAPLLALLFAKGSAGRYLALLCPLLVIFLLLPLRFSFAQAMTARYRHEPFTLKEAFSFSLYGEKLSEGLLYALHIIKWMLPLLAAGAVLYYVYMQTEAFYLVKGITDFGTGAAALWAGLLNFIVGIFGGTYTALPGGIMEGLYTILGIVGLCVLILLLGVVRTSAYRYIWAEATELDKNPRVEARRSLRGRRWKQLGVSLMNLVLLLPALIVFIQIIQPKQAIDDLAMRLADALVAGTVPVIEIPYGKLALVFFVCYLPFVPLRRMLTAHFATAYIRRQTFASEPAQEESAASPLLYEDKPDVPNGRNA